MSRKTAREEAFKLIFQIEAQKSSPDEILSYYFEQNDISDLDKEYINDISMGVFGNLSYIDGFISENARDWKINRISKVGLSLLRLCVYEMTKRDDIPTSVSVNEVVKLAKKYDDINSASFINGILGSVDKAIIAQQEAKNKV